MINIVSGWWGDRYGIDYPVRLRQSILANTHRHDLRFWLLTDRDAPEGWDAIRFTRNWKGCWPKVEMYRPDICPRERVVWCDLDMIPVGSLDEIFDYAGRLGVRREFTANEMGSSVQSSWVMFEGGSLSYIFERLCEIDDPDTVAPTGKAGSDQLWLSIHKGLDWDDLEEVFPGAFVSYKRHWRHARRPKRRHRRRGVTTLPNARVVYFYGRPKPDQINWNL